MVPFGAQLAHAAERAHRSLIGYPRVDRARPLMLLVVPLPLTARMTHLTSPWPRARIASGCRSVVAQCPAFSRMEVPPWQRRTRPTSTSPFERSSKRRKGFPSETFVRRGHRVVHGNKELFEKLGRNDLCPCDSGRRFQGLLHANRPLRRGNPLILLLGSRP